MSTTNKTSSGQKITAWQKTDGFCFYCGLELDPFNFHTDHFIPRCLGGGDEEENLVPACKKCNTSKGGRSIEDFRALVSRKKIGCPTFNEKQLDWLAKNGIILPIPKMDFYFETNDKISFIPPTTKLKTSI